MGPAAWRLLTVTALAAGCSGGLAAISPAAMPHTATVRHHKAACPPRPRSARRRARHAAACRHPRHGLTAPMPAPAPTTAPPPATTIPPPATAGAPTTPPGVETPAGGPPAVPRVQVTAVEFSFTLSRTTVPAGKVILEFVDKGQDEHNLNALGPEGELAGTFANEKSGGVADQAVVLKKGSFTLFCSLPEHEQKGMKATLLVQ